ncbi:MAG: 2-C-methyl-D-erythritol 2,4-cyclodiphosphate synthase [Clostridia bacterium]|nr:2-C-methyl-D-erythritol 2,4-cyclodiphosphate synthase [Clostridia bacterium]
MEKHKVSAIICAAGKGERAGFAVNKLLAPLYGVPALWHTLKKFDIDEIDEVIVTSSKTDLKEISALCKPFGYKVVQGGKTRTESVKKALKSVTGDIVLIHDGARPFVKKQLILNCIESVEKFGSGVCAVKLTDSAVSASFGLVCDTLDRENTYRVQTPQGFMTDDIKHAYELAGNKVYTDDCSVYCEFIALARLVDGDEENYKLTYKRDFMRDLPPFISGSRVGMGVDVHAFREGNGIILGGVNIPCDKSFVAHSDGDVIIHALADALLSAAGLKDIGHYFPVDDDAYEGADSRELLKKVIAIIKNVGFEPCNISITVQAEKPRLSPYIDIIKRVLSELTGIPASCIAVAAGTCEGLGFIGEELGVTAYAVTALKEVTNG